MPVEIVDLFRRPRHLPLVAGWIYHEFWADRDGYSPAVFEALLRKATDPGAIPLSLLALAEGRPVGTVNLVDDDDPGRPHLHPWLAALYVVPEHRGRGTGGALVRALAARARALGFDMLYLGTDDPGFYRRLGAAVVEAEPGGHHVMRLPV